MVMKKASTFGMGPLRRMKGKVMSSIFHPEKWKREAGARTFLLFAEIQSLSRALGESWWSVIGTGLGIRDLYLYQFRGMFSLCKVITGARYIRWQYQVTLSDMAVGRRRITSLVVLCWALVSVLNRIVSHIYTYLFRYKEPSFQARQQRYNPWVRRYHKAFARHQVSIP